MQQRCSLSIRYLPKARLLDRSWKAGGVPIVASSRESWFCSVEARRCIDSWFVGQRQQSFTVDL